MRPLLQHAQRSFCTNASLVTPKSSSRTFSTVLRSASSAPAACLQCQHRASVAVRSSRSPQWPWQGLYRRNIHDSSGDEKPKKEETPEERLARVREDIALRERQEQERQEKERLEKEKQEKLRLERQRLEEERLQKERLERERLERERLAKEKENTAGKTPLPNVIELPSSRSSSQPKQVENATLPSSPNAPSPLNKIETRDTEIKGEATRKPLNDDVKRVPDDQLPSHHQAQRWDLSKQFQRFMDDILPKLAVVTQKVNNYTGTDYSGIEALKREIKDYETLVKTRRSAIDEAKQALDIALSQQASAQKEVVALLERKHSWSDRDLERYMSLIRSEHINDQAVREAKESIKQAENALEEARSHLEKRERAQYHEEQIWSDTIRRNSTWVTFGLMGLNIFLLLATMIIIEPWRRRRMVREIKNALEAQKSVVEPIATVAAPVGVVPAELARPFIVTEAEKQFDPVKTVSTSPVAVDEVSSTLPVQQDVPVVTEPPVTNEVLPTTQKHPDETIGKMPLKPIATPIPMEQSVPTESIDIEKEVVEDSTSLPKTWRGKVAYIAQDVISERTISMRRIDYTAAIIQSATAGAVITAAIVAMIVGR